METCFHTFVQLFTRGLNDGPSYGFENSSKTCSTMVNQAEILSDQQLVDDISTSTQTTGREWLLEDSDDVPTKVDNLLRPKRDEQKRAINLPPDYNIYDLPKPNESPIPVFLYFNITKILNWNEFDEVSEVH